MFITEIFKSIQGESSYAGLPCVFVRLTGCNLRCAWCDTAYAFHGGTKFTIQEALARVEELSQPRRDAEASGAGSAVRLVELTGGEPLLQPETPELARRLLASGYTVLIETSGERDVSVLPREVVKIVDVKCPDSGESGTFNLVNLRALERKDEIKFVIASRRDYEFARDFLREHKLAERLREIIFSPVFADPEGKWPEMDRRALAEWILADNLPVRLGLQLHKFIWDPAMHGV
jgi:7-carboxy-7-deazaguanine synthase